jgi:hypothetical protein
MGYETKLYIGEIRDNRSEAVASHREDDGNYRFVRAYKEDVIRPNGINEEGYIGYKRDKNTKIPLNDIEFMYLFDPIASIDLCKTGSDSNIRQLDRKESIATVYMYKECGNEIMCKDRCERRFVVHRASTVLEALKADCEASEYRRFLPAKALVEAIVNGKFRDPMVVFYGH